MSFEGPLTVSILKAFYVDIDDPYSVSIQFYTIFTNVTLSGNSSYAFWNQNVIDYSTRIKRLDLMLKIWNLCYSTAPIKHSTFCNYT